MFKKRPNEGKLKKICNIMPDKKDKRDFIAEETFETALPESVKLSQYDSPIKGQGSAPSCGSHAGMAWLENYFRHHKPRWFIELSERYHYERARNLNGTFPELGGMTVRDICKTIYKYGATPEVLCPYDISKLNESPSLVAKALARFWQIKGYYRCRGLAAVKTQLSRGFAVISGLKVWDNFILNRGEVITKKVGNYRGGHAVEIVDYDNNEKTLTFKNSWLKRWGKSGYGKVSYAYYEKYVIDSWVLLPK